MTGSFKKGMILTAIVLFALLMSIWSVMVSPSFAYFRASVDESGSHNMMIELIFDRLNQKGFDAYAKKYQAVYGSDFEPNEKAEWGTRENPYVISQKYHVQNLSVLQKVGFFEKRVDGEGKPIQAYFLVCNADGTPVVIDCEGMKISPIGTHENVFTGVINGAPASGEAIYREYGSSISGFANLTVVSTLDEPDIGFFGRLGYYGEKEVKEGDFDNDEITVTGGYSATVQDLLLADLTVQSRRSVKEILSDWWAGFSEHANHADEREETHHVGIIAGHAEFATLKNVSVYYSEDVAAFDLISNEEGSRTNYYSATGLIGLLDCVNPVLRDDGVLDGSNAISDSILVGNGSGGGGGDESGTMTGYFLAKNLYDRHEAYLRANRLTTKDKYSVTEMKDTDGKSLFETVTMAERDTIGWNNWEYRNYFYFQDTVFTFAMSMSVASNEDGVATETADERHTDYIQTIWKLEEETPSISATSSFDNLQYGPDPNAKAQVSYYLEAVTSLEEDGYYVLAYQDRGTSSEPDDDVLYILNLNDTNGASGYVRIVPKEEMYGNTVYDDDGNGYIKSMNLIGVFPTYYDYSFQYDKSGGYSIKMPDSDYKFGVTASGDGDYQSPTTVISSSNTASGNITGSQTAFDYGWNFNARSGDSYRFSVTKSHRFGSTIVIYNNYAYGWSRLQFSEGKLSFYSEMSDSSSKQNEAIPLEDNNYFTVFKVNTNTYDAEGNITNESATENRQLTPKNILPESELYSFDPSKYVLQYVGKSSEGGYSLGNYRLVPIRSLKLNNGRGELLSEINHVAKLYKTHNQNYQLTIGNLFSGNFGNLVSNLIDTNSGGVLNTTIGTSNSEVYSIPTGMTAFEINKASEEDPSYINIIVAVNPEQETTGTVGLWAMNKQTWQQSFDLSDPTYSFDLPISKTAKGSSDLKYAIKVTERVVETESEGKRLFNVVTDEQGNKEVSYMYLGGETVLVYYSFSVTSTGVYMLGSKAGPLSVAYFSVTGAAGQGNDGMSGSPLGNVDFVYDFTCDDGKKYIITTDKHYGEDAPLFDDEEYDKYYYPSYLLIGMLPEKDQSGSIVKIQNEVIKIRRYIKTQGDNFGTKRHFKMLGENYTAIRSASPVMEDYQDDIDGS